MSAVGARDLATRLDEYRTWLATAGHAVSTVLTRTIHLRRFVRWADREGWVRLDALTLEALEAYRASVVRSCDARGNPHAWSTRVSRLTAVRLWLRWAVRTHRLATDPSAELVIPRMPRRLPRAVLTADEVERVLRTPDVQDPLGLRDRAILEVMYSTGMRRGEVIRLGVHDMDSERGVVFIREGKGGKDRVVPIGGRALGWVARYRDHSRPILVARRRAGGDPPALFLGARGERIRPSRLTERMHGYVKRSSGKPGSCHVFRHSMATLMHDGGADIRDLQEMLGHAQLSTTEIYTHVSVERLRSVHALTHPAEAGRAWLGRRLGGGISPLLALPAKRGRLAGPWGLGRDGSGHLGR
jgi:integrase/recombinase XerD